MHTPSINFKKQRLILLKMSSSPGRSTDHYYCYQPEFGQVNFFEHGTRKFQKLGERNVTLKSWVSMSPFGSWFWVIRQYFVFFVMSFGLVTLENDFVFFKVGCKTVFSGATTACRCSSHWSWVLHFRFPYLGLLTAMVLTVLGRRRWNISETKSQVGSSRMKILKISMVNCHRFEFIHLFHHGSYHGRGFVRATRCTALGITVTIVIQPGYLRSRTNRFIDI